MRFFDISSLLLGLDSICHQIQWKRTHFSPDAHLADVIAVLLISSTIFMQFVCLSVCLHNHPRFVK